MNAGIINTWDTEKINDFMAYVQNNVKPALYAEVARFIYELIDGHKINVIASHISITESRAYWIRKKIASLYMAYNPIERRSIYWAKVDGVFIRVFPEDAKLTIAGKTHKTTVYLNRDGNIVIPDEHTRIKSYVINVSKKPMNHEHFGCITIPINMAITDTYRHYETIVNIRSEYETILPATQAQYYKAYYECNYGVWTPKKPIVLPK